MEGAGVLLAATPQRLLAIDVTKLKINHYKCSNFEIPPLPVFKEFNLVGEGFPYGMCFFVRESKLYMVGGEKPCAEAPPEMLRVSVDLDESFGDRGLSRDIYVSDLTGLESITNFRKHPLTMLAAKPNPIVAEIEGKIYVLSGAPWHLDCVLPTPTFEVYDPLVGKWEALPEPPFYTAQTVDTQDFRVFGNSVVGNTIYVFAVDCFGRRGYNYYSYCVNDRKWKFLGKSTSDLSIPLPLGPLCRGKFVPAYNDIFIYFHYNHLRAAWIPSDGTPTRYQTLEEVYGDYYLRDMVSDDGVVVELGEHEMCIMKPGILPALDLSLEDLSLEDLPSEDLLSGDVEHPTPGRTTLYMATFRVEKLHSSAQVPKRAMTNAHGPLARGPKLAKTAGASDVSQTSDHDNDAEDGTVLVPPPFLSITCLSKGFYNLDAWGPDTGRICSAIFHQW